MAFIIYIFVLGVNILFAVAKKDSSFVQILTLCFVCALFVGSRDTFDLDNYIQMYERDLIQLRGLQLLYWELMDLCQQIGLNFYQFRLVISAISLSLFYFFIRKTSQNPHIVLLVYLLYPVFMDDIQIRNFVSTSLLCVGIYYLLEEKKNWKVVYSIFVLLAMLNHVLFLIYLIFLIQLKKKEFASLYVVFFCILTIFLVFNKDKLGFIYSIMAFIDADKSEIYAQSTTRFGALMFVAYQLITLFIYKRLIRRVSHHVYPEKIYKYTHIMYRLNVLISICLPLIVIDFNFYRLMRSIFMINIICFTNILVTTMRKGEIFSYTLLYFYLWASVDMFAANNFVERVVPIFENNTLSW